jgi:hypothetical protein
VISSRRTRAGPGGSSVFNTSLLLAWKWKRRDAWPRSIHIQPLRVRGQGFYSRKEAGHCLLEASGGAPPVFVEECLLAQCAALQLAAGSGCCVAGGKDSIDGSGRILFAGGRHGGAPPHLLSCLLPIRCLRGPSAGAMVLFIAVCHCLLEGLGGPCGPALSGHFFFENAVNISPAGPDGMGILMECGRSLFARGWDGWALGRLRPMCITERFRYLDCGGRFRGERTGVLDGVI